MLCRGRWQSALLISVLCVSDANGCKSLRVNLAANAPFEGRVSVPGLARLRPVIRSRPCKGCGPYSDRSVRTMVVQHLFEVIGGLSGPNLRSTVLRSRLAAQ
ncbi:hypothetical protein EDD18DRAFT_1121866 [Armillaria luteobubalina]|uniref:Secreted protein n=1 Tax=Armillaria luteobubalina TaxID=153913 RepID=A0AA39QQ49_9AGAR|nr:hypothetical protein EDD18DRAFT_1121866 [Armillaria luteobubalina]